MKQAVGQCRMCLKKVKLVTKDKIKIIIFVMKVIGEDKWNGRKRIILERTGEGRRRRKGKNQAKKTCET